MSNTPGRASAWRCAVLVSSMPLVFAPSTTAAQTMHDMSGMHHHEAPPVQSSPATTPPAMQTPLPDFTAPSSSTPPAAQTPPENSAPTSDHAGMPGIQHGGALDHSAMTAQMLGQFGPYPMSREASGTSWQPDSTPHQGVHLMAGEWSLMGHANIFGVYDQQGGPRGANKGFAAGMVMGMAQRPVGDGDTLGFRAMLSPDPFMGANGYPLLFATG